jgi:hypothetical protein
MVSGSPDEGNSRHEFSSVDGTLVVTASGYPGGHVVRVQLQEEKGARTVLDEEVKDSER